MPQPEHSANVRRNHGKKCLRAKEGEQQSAVSQAVESGSCEPSAPQVSCSCCSPPNFLPADSPLFGASSSGSNTTCMPVTAAAATAVTLNASIQQQVEVEQQAAALEALAEDLQREHAQQQLLLEQQQL